MAARSMGTARWRSRRGSVLLLFAMGISTTMLLALTNQLSILQTVLNTHTRTLLRAQGLALAEAGLHEALWELNFGGGDFAGWTPLTSEACAAMWGAICFQKAAVALQAGDGSGLTMGTYTVTVFDPTPTQATVVVQGTEAATGTSRTIRATLGLAKKRFRYAAFGHLLELKNENQPGNLLINSYDSTLGAYGGLNVQANGDVGANTVFVIWPDVTVQGKGFVTPQTTVAITPPSTVSGGMQQQPPQAFPSIVVPPELAALSQSPALNLGFVDPNATYTCTTDLRVPSIALVNNARLILEPGCDLYLDGAATDATPWLFIGLHNGTIEARGNNRIFIEHGSFVVHSTNGFVTTTQQPADLQIYARGYYNPNAVDTNGDGPFMESGGSMIGQRQPFHGVAYAQISHLLFLPYRNDSTGVWDPSANGYGALASGNTMVFYSPSAFWEPGTRFHYDESLEDLAFDGTGRVTTFAIDSWQTE